MDQLSLPGAARLCLASASGWSVGAESGAVAGPRRPLPRPDTSLQVPEDADTGLCETWARWRSQVFCALGKSIIILTFAPIAFVFYVGYLYFELKGDCLIIPPCAPYRDILD